MKRGPFVVADRGVGPLITDRGHLVLYIVENGQQQFKWMLLINFVVVLKSRCKSWLEKLFKMKIRVIAFRMI